MKSKNKSREKNSKKKEKQGDSSSYTKYFLGTIFLVLVVIGVYSFMGLNGSTMSRGQAESLALNEYKRSVFKVVSYTAKQKLSSQDSEEVINRYKYNLEKSVVTYSVKKEKAWFVYVTNTKLGEGAIEVQVYSRNSIVIPELEKSLTGMI